MSTDDRPMPAPDAALLAQLGQALDMYEAVPADALAVALAAFELGRVDDELANLVFDSLLDDAPVAMRHAGVAEARALAFTSQGRRIDIELLEDDGTLLGQLDPPGVARIELESAAGVRHTDSDDLGRFQFEAARGALRLRITTVDQVLIVTPWITW